MTSTMWMQWRSKPHREPWSAMSSASTTERETRHLLDSGDCGKRSGTALREYYWDARKEGQQKTDQEYADDLRELAGGLNID